MTQPSEPEAARPYRGGCHCGAVHYEVKLDLAHPSDPSCSVWEHRVQAGSFRLLIGEESLTGYQFFDDTVHHFFCVRCGVRVYSHHLIDAGSDRYAVDVRTLHSRRAPHQGCLHVDTSALLRPG